MDILLILQPLQDACINLSNEINNGLTYGSFVAVGVAAGAAAIGAGAKALINSKGIKDK